MALRVSFGAVVSGIALTGALVLAASPAAGQRPPASQAPPPGWSAAVQTMLQLTLDGKPRDVIALAETWVKKHPTFAEAWLMLGSGYESMARDLARSRPPGAGAERIALLETAATHLRRAFELGGERPEIPIRTLVDLYGPLGLNRPDDEEKVVREALSRYPSEPRAHIEHLRLLFAKQADAAAVDRAVTAARAALPKTADARLAVGSQLAFYAAGHEPLVTLSADGSAALARVALTFVHDALALEPTHAGALKEQAALAQLRTPRP